MCKPALEYDSLFDVLKEKMQYDYISDLRDMNKNIDGGLDYVLLSIDANDYDANQWRDLTNYLFPRARIEILAEAEELRNALILAIYEYRKLKDQVMLINALH